MQLGHVAVGKHVIPVDLLAVEAGGPPYPRVLDPIPELLVDGERQRPNRGAAFQDEGFLEVGLLPRLLRVDPDTRQALEERGPKILETGAVLGGDGVKRNPGWDGAPCEGRERLIRIEVAFVPDGDHRLHQEKRWRVGSHRSAYGPYQRRNHDRQERVEALFYVVRGDLQHEANPVD